MKKPIFFIIPLLAALWCMAAAPELHRTTAQAVELRQVMADSALAYCKAKGMNTDLCLLVDMKLHSGRKRMWVWDFNEGKPILSSLCAHGCGQESTGSLPVFSNVSGSNCTSLGKYRLGARAWSNWGINVHYKMHGLESTNNNAYKRIVVLHSFTPIPDREIYPLHLPMGVSLGCPVISDTAMTEIDSLLSKSSKPVLLWVYY